ncbi:MAG TPA: hypothetical protein VFG83_09675, partial [Kofleriaceae bacterium]|nr:hypothetical protein [Kofleriaceae bacterium]
MLETLTEQRLRDLSRTFGIGLRSGRETKARMAALIGAQLTAGLPAVLRELGRDELRTVCRRHGVPDDSRSRADLQARLKAAGLQPDKPPPPPTRPLGRPNLATPLTRESLVAFDIRHQLDTISAALSGHSRPACLDIIDVALAGRAKHNIPAPELVWTGPAGHGAMARDTAIVLRELFESARHQVVLAGYSFWNATDVLAPLHQVMRDHAVATTFFVNINQADTPTSPPERHAEQELANFTRDIWPFGPPYPAVFYDKRALHPGPPFASLHAKCVVIDNHRAFISSANFTQR